MLSSYSIFNLKIDIACFHFPTILQQFVYKYYNTTIYFLFQVSSSGKLQCTEHDRLDAVTVHALRLTASFVSSYKYLHFLKTTRKRHDFYITTELRV